MLERIAELHQRGTLTMTTADAGCLSLVYGPKDR